MGLDKYDSPHLGSFKNINPMCNISNLNSHITVMNKSVGDALSSNISNFNNNHNNLTSGNGSMTSGAGSMMSGTGSMTSGAGRNANSVTNSHANSTTHSNMNSSINFPITTTTMINHKRENSNPISV